MVGDDRIAALIAATLETTSRHTLVDTFDVSRVSRAFGLAPHKHDSWKLSKDPLRPKRPSIYSETAFNSAQAWSI